MYEILVEGKRKNFPLLLLSLAVLISVRASMAIAVIVVGCVWIFMKSKNKLTKLILYGGLASFMLLFALPVILAYTGGYLGNVGTLLNLSKRASVGIKITPSEKSLSDMFVTDNPIKAIIFAPIRTLFH